MVVNMGHHDAQHYAAKHAPDSDMNPRIAEAVEHAAVNGAITCMKAHGIAEELQVTAVDVGKTIDLLNIKITHCQLGLFGYAPQRRIVEAADSVAPDVQSALERTQQHNRLACSAAWQLAAQFSMSRLEIAAACEALKIKISHCQLGTF